MKKIVKVLFIGALIGLLALQNYNEHYYIKSDCKVLQVCDGIATIEDSTGNIYDIKVNDIKTGDTVQLKMLTIDGKYDDYNKVVKVIKK